MSSTLGRAAARLAKGTRFTADEVEPIFKNLDDAEVEQLSSSVRRMDDADVERLLRRVEERSVLERIGTQAARVGADQPSRATGKLAGEFKSAAIGVTGLGAGGAAAWGYTDWKEEAEKADTDREIASLIEQIRNDDSLSAAEKAAAIRQVRDIYGRDDDDGGLVNFSEMGYFGKFAFLMALYFIGKAAVGQMGGN